MDSETILDWVRNAQTEILVHTLIMLEPIDEWQKELGFGLTNVQVAQGFYVVTIGLLSLIIFLTCCRPSTRSKGKKGNSILIWGPCGAGKTTLFYRLREKAFPKTITSMVANEDKITIGKKVHNVIDFPGHQRLRAELMTTYLRKAGKVIFVIDASNLKATLPSVAQQLYDLLTRTFISESSVPVVIACNKSDDPTAATPDQARSLLEAELNKIRTTRSSNPTLTGNQDGDDSESSAIGVVGKPFKFEDLDHDLDFVSCSCFKNEIDSLKSVISDI